MDSVMRRLFLICSATIFTMILYFSIVYYLNIEYEATVLVVIFAICVISWLVGYMSLKGKTQSFDDNIQANFDLIEGLILGSIYSLAVIDVNLDVWIAVFCIILILISLLNIIINRILKKPFNDMYIIFQSLLSIPLLLLITDYSLIEVHYHFYFLPLFYILKLFINEEYLNNILIESEAFNKKLYVLKGQVKKKQIYGIRYIRHRNYFAINENDFNRISNEDLKTMRYISDISIIKETIKNKLLMSIIMLGIIFFSYILSINLYNSFQLFLVIIGIIFFVIGVRVLVNKNYYYGLVLYLVKQNITFEEYYQLQSYFDNNNYIDKYRIKKVQKYYENSN